MKILQIVFLGMVPLCTSAQSYCDLNFGSFWNTTQLHYSDADSNKCVFDLRDTIDFVAFPTDNDVKSYQYLSLNCEDSTFIYYSVDTIAAYNESGEKIYASILCGSDADKGKWTCDTIKNTISFKVKSFPETYTFQIINMGNSSLNKGVRGILRYGAIWYLDYRYLVRLIRINKS